MVISLFCALSQPDKARRDYGGCAASHRPRRTDSPPEAVLNSLVLWSRKYAIRPCIPRNGRSHRCGRADFDRIKNRARTGVNRSERFQTVGCYSYSPQARTRTMTWTLLISVPAGGTGMPLTVTTWPEMSCRTPLVSQKK
jgi:hypothetical protein